MPHAFWILLLAKMTTTAIIVVAASKVVERAGPFLGAMVATLPISAGPSYIFLAAEHGGDFVHRAALTSDHTADAAAVAICHLGSAPLRRAIGG